MNVQGQRRRHVYGNAERETWRKAGRIEKEGRRKGKEEWAWGGRKEGSQIRDGREQGKKEEEKKGSLDEWGEGMGCWRISKEVSYWWNVCLCTSQSVYTNIHEMYGNRVPEIIYCFHATKPCHHSGQSQRFWGRPASSSSSSDIFFCFFVLLHMPLLWVNGHLGHFRI